MVHRIFKLHDQRFIELPRVSIRISHNKTKDDPRPWRVVAKFSGLTQPEIIGRFATPEEAIQFRDAETQ